MFCSAMLLWLGSLFCLIMKENFKIIKIKPFWWFSSIFSNKDCLFFSYSGHGIFFGNWKFFYCFLVILKIIPEIAFINIILEIFIKIFIGNWKIKWKNWNFHKLFHVFHNLFYWKLYKSSLCEWNFSKENLPFSEEN